MSKSSLRPPRKLSRCWHPASCTACRMAAWLLAVLLLLEGSMFSSSSPPLAPLEKVFQYIDLHQDEFVQMLKEWVAIKSDSVQPGPHFRQELFRMMAMAADMLQRLGAHVASVDMGSQQLPDGQSLPIPPVILAELGNDPTKATVCFYGHLDVQPADRADGWLTDPYMLTEVDGKLYGRGATDNKGPVLAWINAVSAFRALEQDLPVNIKLIIEGMEEAGSVALEELMEKEKDRFFSGVDYIVISDNLWLSQRKPAITYGTRGNSYFTVEVSTDSNAWVEACGGCEWERQPIPGSWGGRESFLRTGALPGTHGLRGRGGCRGLGGYKPLTLGVDVPVCIVQERGFAGGCDSQSKAWKLWLWDLQAGTAAHREVKCRDQDFHSGTFGGILHEPMADLVALLGSLVDSSGHILVPGIYDEVAPLTEEEINAYKAIDLDLEEYRNSSQVAKFLFDTKEEILMHLWRYPSLSIHGIEGAFDEPGAKTVIPGRVIGKFSVRLVPHMNVSVVEKQVTQHLEDVFSKRNSSNDMVVSMALGLHPWIANINDTQYIAAKRAIRTVFGTDPDMIRDGSTIPIAKMFQEIVHKSVVMIPLGAVDDGEHSQNEKINSSEAEMINIHTCMPFSSPCAKMSFFNSKFFTFPEIDATLPAPRPPIPSSSHQKRPTLSLANICARAAPW
ncbi:LOW QUALITY PROTEIN: Beta-Ala-His dipeptidase [Plecturocebus cupreus]